MKSSRLRVIVTGLIAQHPGLGGVAWDYLQYVVGLARLGHDVYYFEDSGEWPYTLDGGASGRDWIAYDCTANVSHLAAVMDRFGLEGRWAYRFPITPQWFGLPARERKAVIASADLLINVSGTLRRPADYRRVPRLVYIDSDPVFTQIKLSLLRGHVKFRKRVDAHDVHMSFGEALGRPVPDTGHRWRPTRQPVLLSEWRNSAPPGEAFTTVMSWTSYAPLTYARQKFGQKDVELLRFIDLPSRVSPATLEVALNQTQHSNWEVEARAPFSDRRARAAPRMSAAELLALKGWRIADTARVARDLDTYRQYIQASKAEWSVAKNGYVRGQPGWFSCRSACYLAAGRPVVVQDTGFGQILPVGEGILGFTTMEEAVACTREVVSNYDRHAKAASAIAEEYFDSDKVLTHLIEDALSLQGRTP